MTEVFAVAVTLALFGAVWYPSLRDRWSRRLARRELPVWAESHGFTMGTRGDLVDLQGSWDDYRVVIRPDQHMRVAVQLKHPPGFSVMKAGSFWNDLMLALLRQTPDYETEFDFGDPLLDGFFKMRARQYQSQTIDHLLGQPATLEALRHFVSRWGPRLGVVTLTNDLQVSPIVGSTRNAHSIRPWLLDQLLPDLVALARSIDQAVGSSPRD